MKPKIPTTLESYAKFYAPLPARLKNLARIIAKECGSAPHVKEPSQKQCAILTKIEYALKQTPPTPSTLAPIRLMIEEAHRYFKPSKLELYDNLWGSMCNHVIKLLRQMEEDLRIILATLPP